MELSDTSGWFARCANVSAATLPRHSARPATALAIQHDCLSLLALPAEIRLEIYAHALKETVPIHITSPLPPVPADCTLRDHLIYYGHGTEQSPPKFHSLLLVNRTVREEALPVYYQVNHFWAEAGFTYINWDACGFMNKRFWDWITLAGDNVKHIRNLVLRRDDGFDIRITINPGREADLRIDRNPWTLRQQYFGAFAVDATEEARKSVEARLRLLLPEEGKFTVESLQKICMAVF